MLVSFVFSDHFQENIIFITVSLLDNVNGPLEILEVMWDKLIDGQRPKFRSIEDARNQLNEKAKVKKISADFASFR